MLIDSNILVFAIHTRSSKHKRAQEFLQAHAGELIIAHQNILESLRVLTHGKFPSPMSPAEAIGAVNQIMKASTIIAPDYKTHLITLEFIMQFHLRADRIFDAYLAATALSNDITTIATDNEKDFQKYPLTVINPFS